MVAQYLTGSHLRTYYRSLKDFALIRRLALITVVIRPRTKFLIRLSSVVFCLHLNLCCVSSRAQSVVQFASARGEVTEGEACNLHLSIEPPAPKPLAVLIRPLFGGDYTASASDLADTNEQSIVIPAGLRSWDAWSSVYDDGTPEADETVGFTIIGVSGPATRGAPTNIIFTIHNGKAQVSASIGTVEGAAYLDLYRSGDLNPEIRVSYTITNGTARPNIDYIPTNGTVTIPTHFRNARVDLSSIIFDNGTVDGQRTVLVELRQDANGESTIIWPLQEFPLGDNEIAGSLVPDFKIAGRLLGLEPDGRLLVYGPLPTGSGRGVFRALPAGRMDPSFSISLNRPQPLPEIGSLRYEPFAAREMDGSWLLTWKDNDADSFPAKLVRLHADGKLDSNFQPAIGGLSNFELDLSPIWPLRDLPFPARGVGPNWPLPKGQFLTHVINRTDGKYAVLRSNADGTLDSVFNPIRSSSGHRVLAVTATGKILIEFVANTPHERFSLRLSDGSVDGLFDAADIGEWCDTLEIDAALEQPDGKIVVSARPWPGDSQPPRVSKMARFLADGKRDTTFAEAEFRGVLRLIALDSDQRISAALIDSEIILAGTDGSLKRLPFPPLRLTKYALELEGTVLVEALLGDSPGRPYIFRCDLSQTFEPRVDFERNAYEGVSLERTEVWESTGGYELIVRRLGNISKALPVRVETEDDTARAGEDYVPISQVLTFAPFEMEKTIVVSILKDQKAERDEEFSVVLTDPNNPSRSPATLRIHVLDEEPSRMFTLGPIQEPAFGFRPSFTRLIFNARLTESWHVEASTDLQSWSREGLEGNIDGSVAREWIDNLGADLPHRFYRAVKE